MLRVLHVLDHSLPLHSGYAFRTRAILKAQERAGIHVRGITGLRHMGTGPDREEADGLTFHRTSGRALPLPGLGEVQEIAMLARAIERLCRQWQPHLLHAHSPALCGAAALRAGRRLGLPVVYEIRAFWEDAAVGNGQGQEGSVKYRLTRALENHVVARAGHVVTICAGLRDDLVTRGTDPSRITLVPNGVDMALFGSHPPRDAALAAQLDLGPGPVLGFIGSFYPYEGLSDLIEAMPALVARHPAVRLLLVGGGPCTEALMAQAEASPAATAIRCVGRVPHGEVDRYYGLCDVMVYPRGRSRLTDLVTPLKPLEAMAQSRLVAASDVGGHRELMPAGTGVLFPPDDPAACAAALADLIDRRPQWPAMQAAARDHVRRHHDWAVNVERYQAVYQDLLNRRAPA